MVLVTTETSIRGIIFRRNIRASYASLDLVIVPGHTHPNDGATHPNGKEEHVVALIQFAKQQPVEHPEEEGGNATNGDSQSLLRPTECRSYIRRMCKLGNEVVLREGRWITNDNECRNGIEDGDDCVTMEETRRGTASPSLHFNKCQARRFELRNYWHETPIHGAEGVGGNDLKPPRIQITNVQLWDMMQCQSARAMYYPNHPYVSAATTTTLTSDKSKDDILKHDRNGIPSQQQQKQKHLSMSKRKKKEASGQTGHGGGIGKRKQGEIVAEFLIQIMTKASQTKRQGVKSGIQNPCSSTTTTTTPSVKDNHSLQEERYQTIHHLSSGTGVVDAAGGSGHVSLALGLRGIKSTVVDPRETVGRLPSRDRKVLRRAAKRKLVSGEEGDDENDDDDARVIIPKQVLAIQPPPPPSPIEFSALRAWFVSRPEGVDLEFRQGSTVGGGTNNDDSVGGGGDRPTSTNAHDTTQTNVTTTQRNTIPICSMCSPDKLLPTCTAIVALHPDEATGSIVDFAVTHRIPFVVIPCCVFSRLFPFRYKPLPAAGAEMDEEGLGTPKKREIVSTYKDLIEYLVDKDDSIQVSELDFDGANLALWSIF